MRTRRGIGHLEQAREHRVMICPTSPSGDIMSSMIPRIALVLLAATTVAAGDPVPTPTLAATPVPTLVPPALSDPPPKRPVPRSLRDDAKRVAADLAAGGPGNRNPDLLLLPWQVGRWSLDGRASKLEAGAGGAALVGEATLGLGGSPLAAFAAFAAAATLDAAAADAEAASPPKPRKTKRIKHTLR